MDRASLISTNFATGKGEDNFITGESEDKFVVKKPETTIITPQTKLKQITDTTAKVVETIDKPPIDKKIPKKDLEKDEQYFQDILTYRKGRFNVDKTEGTNFVMLPFFKQDLTKENLVDDYLDHYRFITSNEIDVFEELDWLKSLKKKEELALKNAKESKSQKQQNYYLGIAKESNNLRQVAARLYRKTSQLADITDSERYEGMSTYEAISDVVDTVGGHIATQLSSPLSAISVFAGKLVAKQIAQKTGIGKISQILIAAATTAPIDATQAAVVDVIAQGAEMEMGIRKKYDVNRTLVVSGTSGVTSGILSGVGQRLALRKGSGLTKEGIDNALKKIKKEQGKLATKKIKELGGSIKDVENTFGKKAVQRNAKGEVININEDVIKKAGREKLEKLDKAGYKVDIIEPAMNFNTYKRVLAGVGELMELGKKNIDDIIDIDEGLMRTLGKDPVQARIDAKNEVANLFRPLGKKEAISSRVFQILLNDNVKKDLPYRILAKYGVTSKDFSAMMLAEISRAGKKLVTVRNLPRQLARGNRDATVDELEERLAQTYTSKRFSELYYRFENIRRGTLVSGIATAQRNGLAQIPRLTMDTLIYGIESAFNPNKKFSIKATMSQLNYTFLNTNDGVLISNALLDQFDVAKARMWNQYSEVGHQIRKRNPNQAALSTLKTKKSKQKIKAPSGLGKEREGIVDFTLDKWENLIHHFNIFNRFQESLFRRGSFMASIERQLINKRQNLDIVNVMKEGTFLKHVDDDMMKKAVDDALNFTYASDPVFKPFKEINKFMTNYGTIFAPFPRFMLKAVEMAYNYNVTGAITGASRIMAQRVSRGAFKNIDDGAYKQMAEGLVGSFLLMPLGYILRDPENKMAGSEFYKLNDNKGREVDMRVFGPIITPYLLFGEMLHRAERGVTQIPFGEVAKAISGANFRSLFSIDNTLGEFIKYYSDGNEKAFEVLFGGVGRILGEAYTGYGQFFLQFSDIAPESDRRRDYKKDPIYDGMVDAFMQEFSLPFKRRLDAFRDEPNVPFARDPRVTDIPERVLPFMKVLFGSTLNRQPPKYIYELGQMGFTYADFMAKTSMPTINRLADKKTAEYLQIEMNTFLSMLKRDPAFQTTRKDLSMPKDVVNEISEGLGYEPLFISKEVEPDRANSLYGDSQLNTRFDMKKALGYVDSYVKSIKKQALAEAKAEVEKNNPLLGLLIRYKGINPKARMSAEQMYKARKAKKLRIKEEEVTIDYENYEELFQIFKEAGSIKSSGSLRRNFTPDRAQQMLFK